MLLRVLCLAAAVVAPVVAARAAAPDPPLPCPCGDARLCGPLGEEGRAALAARSAEVVAFYDKGSAHEDKKLRVTLNKAAKKFGNVARSKQAPLGEGAGRLSSTTPVAAGRSGRGGVCRGAGACA